MYEEFFPKRLTRLREQKGVSAREMSLDIGQNPNYINQIENRRMLPKMQAFFYICEYLGITPGQFFDEGNAYPAKVGTLLSLSQRMDAGDLDSMIAIAKKITAK